MGQNGSEHRWSGAGLVPLIAVSLRTHETQGLARFKIEIRKRVAIWKLNFTYL